MIASNSTKLAGTVFVAFLMISSVVFGNSLNTSNTANAYLISASNTASMVSSFVIDGDITADEWSAAVHKIQWYMDADPENSDGYNYMYIDEDPYNLYVALDL